MYAVVGFVLVFASLFSIQWISNCFRNERNRARIEANPENYKRVQRVGHAHWTDTCVDHKKYEYVGDKPSEACRKIMEHEEQR